MKILAETAEAKIQLDAIQSRHQELLKIEHSLEEMRNQFVELAILIENQVCMKAWKILLKNC